MFVISFLLAKIAIYLNIFDKLIFFDLVIALHYYLTLNLNSNFNLKLIFKYFTLLTVSLINLLEKTLIF